ncbi:hypothetical protein DPMN_187650 [Dreissena polymorpha]|uniref:Uncharacterized protein n=1 Tax=Dreissena polymorpha TaxID=45954 RepID=A0A9D4DPG7_DREPO|nr:hypothetical protein DPMN_187650 [Dreissena polymorpha]
MDYEEDAREFVLETIKPKLIELEYFWNIAAHITNEETNHRWKALAKIMFYDSDSTRGLPGALQILQQNAYIDYPINWITCPISSAGTLSWDSAGVQLSCNSAELSWDSAGLQMMDLVSHKLSCDSAGLQISGSLDHVSHKLSCDSADLSWDTAGLSCDNAEAQISGSHRAGLQISGSRVPFLFPSLIAQLCITGPIPYYITNSSDKTGLGYR